MGNLYKGMRLDETPENQIEGSWRWALNMVYNIEKKGVTVEEGLTNLNLPASQSANTRCIGKIDCDSCIIYFQTDVLNGVRRIYKYDLDTQVLTLILAGSVLTTLLDINNPIKGTFCRNAKGELIIAWTDGVNPYQILNVDNLGFLIDVNKVAVDVTKAQNKLLLFRDCSFGTITAVSTIIGNLQTGVYYPCYRFEDEQGYSTDYSDIKNGITIALQEDSTLETFTGNTAIQSSKGFKLSLSFIDSRYDYIIPAYIYQKNNGETYLYEEAKIKITNYTTFDINITGKNQELLDINTALVPHAKYKRGRSITNFQDQLILGNLEEEEHESMQRWVNKWVHLKWAVKNNVNVECVETDNGNNYGSASLDNKSLKWGEVYAFYIRLVFTDGTKSRSYHIPGNPLKLNDYVLTANAVPYNMKADNTDLRSLDALYDSLDSVNPVPYNRVFDTCGLDSFVGSGSGTIYRGDTGTWENDDELYPLNSAGAVHNSFSNITKNQNVPINPNIPIDVGSRKVRHHVMPTTTFIDEVVSRAFAGGPTTGIVGDSVTHRNYILGLNTQVTMNSEFPASLKVYRGGVRYYEILYAKRGEDDIKIYCTDGIVNAAADGATVNGITVSHGAVIPTYLTGDYDRYRIYPFDFLAKNYVPKIKYAKYLGAKNLDASFSTGGNPNLKTTIYSYTNPAGCFDVTLTKIISKVKYAGEGTTSQKGNVLYDNVNYSDTISLGMTGVVSSTDQYLSGSFLQMFDFCEYRKNVYFGFNNQTLIPITSIGVDFITINGTYINEFFGGDVFNCMVYTAMFADSYAVSANANVQRVLGVYTQTYSNVLLRQDNGTGTKSYFPKVGLKPIISSYYGYDRAWDSINEFNSITNISYPDLLKTDTDPFVDVKKLLVNPYLIVKSDVVSSESNRLGWNYFKVNNYYIIRKDRGGIENLQAYNKTLIIHTENGLFTTEIKDSLNTSDDTQIQLGVSDIFTRPPQEILYNNGNYLGTKSKFAANITPLGYVFINENLGKVFIFNLNNGVDEISIKGMREFFKDNSKLTDINVDNPYNNNGFVTGYNIKDDLLFITKHDANTSFTISYSRNLNNGEGGWNSFHSTLPVTYSNIQNNLNLTDNNGTIICSKLLFALSAMNSAANIANNINSYIDVVVNDTPTQTKQFNNLTIFSVKEKISDKTKYKTKTATHLMLYNHNQCSGVISLIHDVNPTWFNNDVRNVEDSFLFNDFRDIMSNTDLPILDKFGGLVVGSLNNNKQWFEKSKFISKFAIFRIIDDNVFNNANLSKLTLIGVYSNIKKSDR